MRIVRFYLVQFKDLLIALCLQIMQATILKDQSREALAGLDASAREHVLGYGLAG